MRTTKADLFYNGQPVPIDSIEFDSSKLTADELIQKFSEYFYKRIKIVYDEKNHYKKG